MPWFFFFFFAKKGHKTPYAVPVFGQHLNSSALRICGGSDEGARPALNPQEDG